MSKEEVKKTQKKESVKEDMKTKTIYEKLQTARAEMAEVELKKGGQNEYSGYFYFSLNDFLPIANKILKDNRLTPVFNIWENEAILVVYDFDSEDSISFRTDNADATMLNKSGKPINLEIQTIGSQHTYLKRYLYMNALEIAESDTIEDNTENPDYTPNVPKKKAAPVEKATAEQLEIVRHLFTPERIDKMLALTEPPQEKLEDMPKGILHEIIIKEQKSREKEAEQKKHVPSLDDII